MTPSLQEHTGFKNGTPSFTWIASFIRRQYEINSRALHLFDESRVSSSAASLAGECLAMVQAAIDRYNIHNPERIFNLN